MAWAQVTFRLLALLGASMLAFGITTIFSESGAEAMERAVGFSLSGGRGACVEESPDVGLDVWLGLELGVVPWVLAPMLAVGLVQACFIGPAFVAFVHGGLSVTMDLVGVTAAQVARARARSGEESRRREGGEESRRRVRSTIPRDPLATPDVGVGGGAGVGGEAADEGAGAEDAEPGEQSEARERLLDAWRRVLERGPGALGSALREYRACRQLRVQGLAPLGNVWNAVVARGLGELSSKWSPSLTTLRDLVAAPLLEEWVFRACLVPLMVSGGWGVVGTSLLAPTVFSASHAHHVVESLRRGVPLAAALRGVALQAAYTYLFGAFATWLLLRSNSFPAVLLAHALCNFYGFPDFSWLALRRSAPSFLDWGRDAFRRDANALSRPDAGEARLMPPERDPSLQPLLPWFWPIALIHASGILVFFALVLAFSLLLDPLGAGPLLALARTC
jgi:Type II CAAX prenyl endopeptidase Rce1-like